MREYLKNKNEYIEDGKHYIETIQKCSIREKIGDTYVLECKIIQRGTDIYTYDDPDYLTKFHEKKFWLSEQAKETVKAVTDDFEQTIKEIKEGDYTIIPMKYLAMTIYFKHKDRCRFHFMLEFFDEKEGNQLVTQIFNVNSIGDMIKEIEFSSRSIKKETTKMDDLLTFSTRKIIHQNPIYQAAVQTGDVLLQHQIKLYYRIANNEECAWLSDLYGVRILPSLSKDYDRDYVVDRASIDGALLEHSGYEIRHRPYFSMQGYTHTKYTLNPYTKKGRDAARYDETPISFQEYLELFEKNNTEEGC